jgi:purine-binding chemotaxis protein CheW
MRQDELEAKTFIVFTIAAYHLAMPIETVLKVVKLPYNTSQELNELGFVQLGQRIIQVIDLHEWLGTQETNQSSQHQSFLVITSKPQAELCGILVHEPPNLIRFSPQEMQRLPQSNHQSRLLEIASHSIVILQDEAPTTIFLLEISRWLRLNVKSQNPEASVARTILG